MIDVTRFAYRCYKGTESSQGVAKGLWATQKVAMVALEVIVIGAALAAYFYFGTGFTIPALLGTLIASYEFASLAKTILFHILNKEEASLALSSSQTRNTDTAVSTGTDTSLNTVSINDTVPIDNCIQELQNCGVISSEPQDYWKITATDRSFDDIEWYDEQQIETDEENDTDEDCFPRTYSNNAFKLKSNLRYLQVAIFDETSIMPIGDIITSDPTSPQAFWMMVAQSKITNLIRFVDDNNQDNTYWNKDQSKLMKYGSNIELTLTNEDVSKDHVVIRTFDLVVIVDRARFRQTVTQHEFSSFVDEDNNIPDEIIDLTKRDDLGKVLIEDDEGTGPSGVFYAIRLLNQIGKKVLQDENGGLEVNLPDFVEYLRSFRPGIIETQEDYNLLENYINEVM